MNASSSDSGQDSEITLYNPSTEKAEELDPASLDRDVLDLEISEELAERLLEVSKHLGLNPTIVASRAIDLVCDEIGTLEEDWREDEDQFGTVTLIQRYQARVDLLQALKTESDEASDGKRTTARKKRAPADSGAGSDSGGGGEEELWEAVDESMDVVGEKEVGASSVEIEDAEDESPPTLEFTYGEAALEEGELERRKSDEGADLDEEEEEPGWDAVEAIIQTGEQAKK